MEEGAELLSLDSSLFFSVSVKFFFCSLANYSLRSRKFEVMLFLVGLFTFRVCSCCSFTLDGEL